MLRHNTKTLCWGGTSADSLGITTSIAICFGGWKMPHRYTRRCESWYRWSVQRHLTFKSESVSATRTSCFYTHYSGRREEPGYLTSQAYQLEVYLNLIRHFLGEHWVPPEIGIEYPASSPVVESHFPGTRILAGQEMGYLAVPRSCLHVAARRTDSGDAGKADLPLTENFDYVDTLRSLLRPYMADGYVSEQQAASLINTSVRTMTRRLSDHGLTYGSLIDDIRFSAAKDMLQTPEMKIIAVARSVGFEDHSDFSRMFRRIGGLTPREFRQASQGS